ncbi:MAG: hypothetical protein BRD33_00135 [Bacteroidetes bacterium QH_6_63_17]|nr:MAG: hypothetical protein BRD33_00135 [Bacteroidetes bacterium QH_6_63_17]
MPMPAAVPATETAFLADSFEQLDDPRDEETYPLGEILVRVVRATISGADVAKKEFGGSCLDWFRDRLPHGPGLVHQKWKTSGFFHALEAQFHIPAPRGAIHEWPDRSTGG